MTHILQRLNRVEGTMSNSLEAIRRDLLEVIRTRPEPAPDEAAAVLGQDMRTLSQRVEVVGEEVQRQRMALHEYEQSIMCRDGNVTRRKGSGITDGMPANISDIRPTTSDISPIGSDGNYEEAERSRTQPVVAFNDVSQVEILASRFEDSNRQMLDTMSNNITRAIGRLGSVLGAAGGGDDDDDDGDDDDADGDRGAYARDRRKRGKPKRREDDDESSEGGHPFRRPESIDYYTSRRSGTDQEDDILNFASKGRLRRHMDARQTVTESSQAQVQQGFSNMADMIAASNREYLTIDKYFLGGHPPDIQNVHMFLVLWEENSRKEPNGELPLGRFIPLEHMVVLETEIEEQRNGIFKHHWVCISNNKGRIYSHGKQALTNSALTDVITYVASPKNSSATLTILMRSVWPDRSWTKFTKLEFLQTHLRQFLYEWIAFRSRFELLLDLLEFSKRWLPPFFLRKNQEDGLVDYMIKTCPNPQYMYSVLREARESEGKNRIKDKDKWDTIMDKLIAKLKYWVNLTEKTADANQRMLGRGKIQLVARPPAAVEAAMRRAEREKSRVNAVEDYAQDYEEDPHVTWRAPEEDYTYHREEYLEEDPDDGYKTAPEHDHESKRDGLESDVQRQLQRDEDELLRQQDLWEETQLYGLNSVVLEGKQVCFSFAKFGKCSAEAKGEVCRFSHEAADVERFNTFRTLGPKYTGNRDQLVQLKLGPGKAGSATSPGPRGTSPGVRPPFRDSRTPTAQGRKSSYPPKRG
jgi:hypothetical protein